MGVNVVLERENPPVIKPHQKIWIKYKKGVYFYKHIWHINTIDKNKTINEMEITMLTRIEDLYKTPKTFECANKETYIHLKTALENLVKHYSKSLKKYNQ